MGKDKISDIFNRLMKVFCVSTDSALSTAMRVSRSAIGNWRNRESIPLTECVKVSSKKGISLDWLLTGEGEMYKNASSSVTTSEEMPSYGVEKQLTPREQAVLKMFNSLTEEEKQVIQKALEEKKRLADVEEKIKTLSDELERIKKRA